MCWTDDPVRDFERWDAKREAELEKLPKCSECGEPIQSEYYWEFDGELYCEDCLREHRHSVDLY